MFDQPVSKYLPLPRRNHVANGLTEWQCAQIDDFDADSFDGIVVTTRALDPRKLTPTQETVDVANLLRLNEANLADLPPIKVVRVGAELRILDGHHRACRAAARGELVLARVLQMTQPLPTEGQDATRHKKPSNGRGSAVLGAGGNKGKGGRRVARMEKVGRRKGGFRRKWSWSAHF